MKKTFAERVYEVTSHVPRGKVATYGQIARLAGSPGAARAVGLCMRNNTDTKKVPCHRVVGSNGALTGYAYGKGITTKHEMLVKEKVKFVGSRVDLRSSLWNHE
ncbi:MAG: MGMT family protein [Patescibacteria group bacterium]